MIVRTITDFRPVNLWTDRSSAVSGFTCDTPSCLLGRCNHIVAFTNGLDQAAFIYVLGERLEASNTE
jgi:hypothetical protein